MSGRRSALFACSLVVSVAIFGCGGGNDDKSFQEAEIEQAKQQAANEARQEERQRARARELQREVSRLRRERRRRRASSPGPSPAPSPAPSSGSSCGGGVSVGPNTSCAFARNVRANYYQSSGGNISLNVYSPTTGRYYTMSCTGGSPHVCTGGNNASVYFP
jgi:hypothetical protein